MSFESVIISRLENTGAISAVTNKIYSQRLPEETPFPAISMQLISETPVLTMGAPVELVQARVQIDCYARGYAEAANLGDAVRNALHLYASGVVEAIIFAGRRIDDDRDNDVFNVSQDFIVNYNAQGTP